MRPIKLAAAVVALVTGIVAVYVGYSSPAPGASKLFIEVLAVVLLVNSLVCLYGAVLGFAGSAIVSGLYFLVAVFSWGGGYTGWELAALALALVNVILGIVAYRSSTTIPEQANPMNLPVFG